MPYINRYFHKRELIVPNRTAYNLRPPTVESKYDKETAAQRHITTYEYPFPGQMQPQSTVSFNSNERTTNNANSKGAVKYDYQKRVYSNYSEPIESGIKISSEGLGSSENMIAKIKSPSGKVQYSDIIDCNDCHFNIRFTPTEIGEHVVSVKKGKMHVSGSPFKIHVGNIESGGVQNVQVYGMGLEGGFVDVSNTFSICMKDVGQGKLTVSIDGPSKALIEMIEQGNGSYDVEYKIPNSGEYLCSIKFNNEHIPGSPYKMMIQNNIQYESVYAKKANNITLAAIQNQGVALGRSTSFTLNQSGLHNNVMRAYMITPSNKTEDIKIKSLGNDQFSLRMEPTEKGLHKIYVLLDEKLIPGSPFEVMVGEIIALGNGLIEAKTNETSTFKLDTKNAEPGMLSVTIDGPSKVELNCFQTDDGYEFSYCPLIHGEHVITIKYKNINIKGSPFKINVIGKSAPQVYSTVVSQNATMVNSSPVSLKSYPENVRCRGDGISKAYLGRNNQFIVDASSGGAGVLFVGITGPTKHCEEINVKHIGGKRFQVNYFVQEYGKHLISIRWHDSEIPESPITVYVQ